MRGTSQASLTAVEGRWEPVVEAAGSQATVLGEQLYALVDALDASGSLRRVLADPSVDGDAKAGLAAQLLAAADPRTIAGVQDLVRARWAADADLADAAQRLGTSAVLAAAQSAGGLEQVEQELFAVIGALSGQRDLRRALFDSRVPGSARADLAEQVLGSQISPTTLLLARRAAAAPRGRRYVAWLGDAVDLIAERRHHRVATVTVAAPLSDTQRSRLADVLATALGRQVELDVVVDPRVIGGLRVQSGPDVIDSTVLSRLADARRQLAG